MTESEYNDRLDGIIKDLERTLGRGSIMSGSSIPEEVDVIPTGVPGIDRALGVGGIPRGRITEVFGPESSGKSTLALHVLSEGQQRGLVAAYIDAEHAFDPEYARAIGVDVDSLLISQPDSGEQALEIVEALVRTGEVGCIAIDSVAALVPRAELEGEMGQSFVGLQARLMSGAMRKLTAVTSKSNCALIFLNQLREKVGISWGNPETQPGGRALKFYSSVRIDLRRVQSVDHGQEHEGFMCRVKVVKNKLSPPYKQVDVLLRYGSGFDKYFSLVDEAIRGGAIVKAGSWLSIGELKFHGKDALIDALQNDQLLSERIVLSMR